MLKFHVHDTPAPQGSKRAFRNPHTGRISMVESSGKVGTWREAVKAAALSHHAGEPLTGAVAVVIQFTLPRPKGHYRRGRNAHLLRESAPAFPASRPDLDKLARSSLDALTAAGVFSDDSQVATLVLSKHYPDAERPLPGAFIHVEEMK